MSNDVGINPWFVLLFMTVVVFYIQIDKQKNYYTIPKSEYNELRQDGKVRAYVRKDGKL